MSLDWHSKLSPKRDEVADSAVPNLCGNCGAGEFCRQHHEVHGREKARLLTSQDRVRASGALLFPFPIARCGAKSAYRRLHRLAPLERELFAAVGAMVGQVTSDFNVCGALPALQRIDLLFSTRVQERFPLELPY